MPHACPLPHRTLLRLSGADGGAFLQGLVSNDVRKVIADTACYAALLTPQGKFLHDLFITASADGFLIDCEAERVGDLVRRLLAYKLRSRIDVEDVTARFDVWAVWGGDLPHAFADPRLPALGGRLFVDKGCVPAGVTLADFNTYDTHRLALGVAEGSRDLEIGKSTLAEGNFDFLNGIDWKKGCYVGQELTARMRYRGLAKRRLFPVRNDSTLPPHGTPLLFNGDDVGEMRSSCGGYGLALLKIDVAQQAAHQRHPLTHNATRIFVSIPPWMEIDAPPVNG